MFSLICSLIYKARLAAFSIASTIMTAFQPFFVPFVPLWAIEAFNAIADENFEVHAVVGVLLGSLKAMLSSVFCLFETRVAQVRIILASFIVDTIRSIFSYCISLIPSTVVEIAITVVVERASRSIFSLFFDLFKAALLRTLPAAFFTVFASPGSGSSSPSTTPSTRRPSTRRRRRVRHGVSTDLLIEIPLLLDPTFASKELDLDVPATADFHSPLLPTVNVHQDTALVLINDSAYVDLSLDSLVSSVNADADVTPSWFDLVVADETAATEPDLEGVEKVALALANGVIEDEDSVPVAESSVVVEEPTIASTMAEKDLIPASVTKNVVSGTSVLLSSMPRDSDAVFAASISCALPASVATFPASKLNPTASAFASSGPKSPAVTVRPLDPSASVFVPACVTVIHPKKLDVGVKPSEFVPTPSTSSSSNTSLENSACSGMSANASVMHDTAVDMESKIKNLLASVKGSNTPRALPKPAVSNSPASSVSRKGKKKENNGSSTPNNVKSACAPLASSSRVNTPQPVASATPSSTVDAPARPKKVRVPRPEGFSRKQWSKHLAAEHDKRRTLEAAKLASEKGS